MSETRHQFVLTKIVATLGPASEDVDTIVRLIQAGVRLCRINFSHGTFEEFERLLRHVREASDRTGRYIGVLGDLSGPKFRVGKVVDGGLELPKGGTVRLTSEPLVAEAPPEGEPVVLPVKNAEFLPKVRKGQRVLLNDGAVALECTLEAEDGETSSIECTTLAGGPITSFKGINLPDTDLKLPSLTEWDRRCVDFAVEQGFDFLALSFVRSGGDVRVLKDRLRELGARPAKPEKPKAGAGPMFSSYGGGSRSFIPVVAKIEKPQAIDDLDAIVDEADVIMVARGDLGVELDLAQVPVIQKQIVRTCHHLGKPVIVATQMLQSMIASPIPTRAEASDVANAIFEGADAVMLSGETAVGHYPEETVRTMRRIARHTNEFRLSRGLEFEAPRVARVSRYRTSSIAKGVNTIVQDLDANLIVMWSQHGGGASYMSQNKLPVPILAYSSNAEALRRTSVLYGVVPRFMEQPESTTAFIAEVDRELLANGWAAEGDVVVLVMGEPIGEAGLTNKIRVHYVGDI